MPDHQARPPTITRNDVVRLLALAAGADQRTVGEHDVVLWHEAAKLHRWTFPAASRVIIEHYASGADRPRITPAAVTDRLRTLRGKAAESFDLPRIPADVPDADWPRYLRAQLAEHTDQVLAGWAETGGPMPTRQIEPARRPMGLAELVAAAPVEHRDRLLAGARTAGALPRSGGAGPVAETRPGVRDPHRMAAARAELDSVRPRDGASS